MLRYLNRVSVGMLGGLALVSMLAGGIAYGQVSVGLNFTGTSISDLGSLNDGFMFIPPDTMGAIGPNSFAQFTNGSFAVYDKITGALIGSRESLTDFWTNAGVTGLNNNLAASGAVGTSDPHILYDAASGRWYATAIDDASGAANNHFLVAVSNSSDPTGGWSGFALSENNNTFHDFDMLGINGDAIYVGTNDFGTNDSTTLLVIPKSGLLAATPTVSGATFFSNDPNATGFSARPVVDLNNGSGSEKVLSDFNATNLKASTILATNTASPTLSTAGGFISVATQTSPPTAQQPGGPNTISTGDTRFSGSVIKQGTNLWAIDTVSIGGHDALKWYRIDATTNVILEQGTISDANRDYYYGSIAVNPLGDIVIGFTGSSGLTTTGFSGFASSFAVTGTFNGTTTTLNVPQVLQEGVADYNLTFGGTSNRWGDYSQTTIDPNNPLSFWTVQEWASGTNVWSTQITQLIFAGPVSSSAPEPSSLAFALAGLLPVGLCCRIRRRRR